MVSLNNLLNSSQYAEINQVYQTADKLTKPELLIVSIAKLLLNEADASLSIFSGITEELDTADREVNSNLGFYYFLVGNYEVCEAHLIKALGDPDQDYITYARLGALRLVQDNLEDSIASYKEAVALKPENASCHNNLAGVYYRLQDFERALDHYEIARKLNPQLLQATEGYEKSLKILGRGDEYIDDLYEELESKPDSLALVLKISDTLKAYDKTTIAVQEIRKKLLKGPDLTKLCDGETNHEDSCNSRHGQIALRKRLISLQAILQRNAGVIQTIKEIESLQGDLDRNLLLAKIDAYLEAGQREIAEKCLEEHTTLLNEMDILLIKTKFLEERGLYEEAKKLIEKTQQLTVDVELDLRLAQLRTWTGDLSGAQEIYKRHLVSRPQLLTFYINSGGTDIDDEILTSHENSINNDLLPKGVRISAGHALAEVYEKRGEYAKSWELLDKANKLSASDIKWNTAKRDRLIDDLKARFCERYVSENKFEPKTDIIPIFIVGMPRSGTTLLEKILSQNEEIFGAGELPSIPQISRLLKRVTKSDKFYPNNIGLIDNVVQENATKFYLKATEALRGDSKYIVDKMPHNFLHVGLIFTLFPHAKVINLIRDPRDVAISNYQQNFKAKFGGLGYSCSMELIAHELNLHYDITSHWGGLFGEKILDLKYENLVRDTDAEGERIMRYIGSSWSDENLEFHKNSTAVRTASVTQVRQPIYQSSREKWRRYEGNISEFVSLLNPLLLDRYQK